MNSVEDSYFCQSCGGDDAEFFLQAYDRYSIAESSFRLVRCKACGLVSLFPAPDPELVEASYPVTGLNPFLYFQSRDRDFLERFYTLFHPYSLHWRVKQLEKAMGAGRMLDVNCGDGSFLYEMRRRLWEVVGVEKREHAAKFARNTLGLPVFAKIEGLLPDYQHYFDVITFWHSFGQFLQLKELLSQIRNLLHPEGVLLLALPNWLSLDFWFYRQNWAALDVPRRIHHFTPRSLRLLLQKNGLVVEKTRVIPFDIYYNCFLSEKVLLHHRRVNRWSKSIRYTRAFGIAFLAHLLSLSGVGSGMLYFARKGKPLAR